MRALLVRGPAPPDPNLRAALDAGAVEIVAASDAVEALQAIERQAVDIVIIESFPPRVDTLVLCRELRRLEVSRRPPIVFYAPAPPDPNTPFSVAGLSADALVFGPIDPTALVHRLETIVRDMPVIDVPPSDRSSPEQAHQALERRLRWLEEVNRELSVREAYLNAIIENEPEWIMLLGPDGALREMNAAGLRMLEADSFDELRNRCVYPLVVDADRPTIEALVGRVLRGESGTTTFQLIGLKGGRRWLETHAAPLRDAQGGVIGALGVTRDITERKQAEEALQETQARLHLAVQAGGIGIWDWDLRTNRIVWSREHEALWGMTPGTFRGTYEEFDARVHPDDREVLRRAVHRSITERRPYHQEFRVVWPDSSIHWIEGWGEPLYDKTGNPIRMIGVARETTERKRAEQAVRESESQLVAAQERGHFGSWELDLTTRTGVWSREMFRLFDLDPARGTPTLDEFAALVHPDDRGALQRMHERAAQGAERLRFDYRTIPIRGKVRHFQATTDSIRDAQGNVVRLAGTLFDITARKVAEDAVREHQRTLAAIIGNLPGMVYQCGNDPVRTMTFVSAGCMDITGYEPNELENNRVVAYLDLIHPDDSASFRDACQRALQMRQPCSSEYRIIDRSGRTHWVWERAQGVYDDAGRLLRIEGLVQDITARRQAEEKVQRLNRMLAMLSGINAVLVRVHEREALFHAACKLAVETGRFGTAWIGMVDAPAKEVRPIATAGRDEGFVSAIADRLHWRETSSVESIVVTAIRTKQSVVVQDVQNDPRILHKEAYAGREIRSAAILPLLIDDQVVAVLALGAAEQDFFDAEEMRLLSELAGDIAFSLDYIEKEERLNYLAYYDSLTGLANTALFLDRLSRFVRAAEREHHELAVCVMDIDNFKGVNDALGRQAGDAILTELARRLVQCLGDAALVARLGADRFALVAPDIAGDGGVLRLLEETLPRCLKDPFHFGRSELRLAAKFGVALYPADGAQAEMLFRNAEAALKRAKASGNRYLFYTQQMTDRIAEKLSLENKLRRALEREEFVLHYQPKVDAQSGRTVGVEALLRWTSPDGELVLPAKFIPLLEESGLIVAVGVWVIRRAVEDYHYWRALDLEAPPVAVNVSAAQLRQRDFVDTVERAQGDRSPLAAIDLEITESLLMENMDENIERLRSIQARGASIAIDDFGTGYSSLGYLARLPAQVLKIDLSFVARMLHDSDVLTLVSTMISLAHSMRLHVVAEGVETRKQVDVLRRLRCDQLQGYFISPPLPREQIGELLASGARQKQKSPRVRPRRR